MIQAMEKNLNIESYNIPVQEVANYFLNKLDIETEDCISNLKLQKLVYYAQGFVMAIKDKKLFNEPIEAWEHGPVVRVLYNKYKANGKSGIMRTEGLEYPQLEQYPEIMEILDEVYQVYGQFSAWKLRNMTHDETPWLDTSRNEVITDCKMLTFFKTQINS